MTKFNIFIGFFIVIFISGYFIYDKVMVPNINNSVMQDNSVDATSTSIGEKEESLMQKEIKFASVLSDPKCNQINTQKEREYCYADIAEERQDVKICDALAGQEAKNYCYQGIRDYTACLKITRSLGKNLCYANIVNYNSANSVLTNADCNRIDIITAKDFCYHTLAVQNKQSSICTLISRDGEEGDTISICNFNVVVARNECETLDMPRRDLCYNGVALIKNDKSKCVLIQNSEMRNMCEWSVGSQ